MKRSRRRCPTVGASCTTRSRSNEDPPATGDAAVHLPIETARPWSWAVRLHGDGDPCAQADGDADCWDFVRTVGVYIESMGQDAELPRQRIAEGEAPGCVGAMALTPVEAVDLKPYTDGGFRVTAEATVVPPADDVSFATHLVLRAAVF